MRVQVQKFVSSERFQFWIIIAIALNAVVLGLETVSAIQSEWGVVLMFVDTAFISIFVIEILLKLYAFRLSFFKSGWNNFDFIIVLISILLGIVTQPHAKTKLQLIETILQNIIVWKKCMSIVGHIGKTE